jgi:hypothetical protein
MMFVSFNSNTVGGYLMMFVSFNSNTVGASNVVRLFVNNISVISWWSVLLLEETERP